MQLLEIGRDAPGDDEQHKQPAKLRDHGSGDNAQHRQLVDSNNIIRRHRGALPNISTFR